MGGSANVVIRGYSSLSGSNQALFVVDGTPIDNTTGNSASMQTYKHAGILRSKHAGEQSKQVNAPTRN